MPLMVPTSPDTLPVNELIAHIAARYQEVHRRDLPELIELARKVERVLEAAPDAPLGLADALERIFLELDMHMQVEENVLFRAMRQNLDGAIAHPIALMRSEHADYVGELENMRELAHGFIPPEGACGSWRRLYQGAAALDATLREQIRLENEVLFPRFEVAQTRCTCAHA